MFVDEEAEAAIIEDDDLNEEVVIAESLRIPGGSGTEYLKSILEDFLKNSLA